MRNRTTMMLFISAVVAGACGGGSDSTAPQNTPPVTTSAVAMSNLHFTPPSIAVTTGNTVTWTNQDNTAHNVTFANSAITSIGDFSSGTRTAKMPSQPGTYSYQCTIHPGMNGTIVVQ